jgi:hypothetical protein
MYKLERFYDFLPRIYLFSCNFLPLNGTSSLSPALPSRPAGGVDLESRDRLSSTARLEYVWLRFAAVNRIDFKI